MANPNVDPAEIARFGHSAAHWWEPEGEFKTLHVINPIRMEYIRQKISLESRQIIDIGCGGGILTESLARAGANVTGIDLCEPALETAKLHLLESHLNINYQLISAEDMAATHPEQFDVVTCLEMLEHVPDPASVIRACATLAKTGGKIFFSTLNRNAKSWLFAILGAEYLLKLIPRNTHDFRQFIRPSELASWVRAAGLEVQEMTGLQYNPLTHHASLTSDISVNYILVAEKK